MRFGSTENPMEPSKFMNESLFLLHLVLVAGFSLVSLRMGAFALTTLIALFATFANLFVVKQMTLFGMQVTCSDVFAVGSLLAINLLQEFYGKKAAIHASLVFSPRHGAIYCDDAAPPPLSAEPSR